MRGRGVLSPAGRLVLLPVGDDHKEAADPSCAPSGIYSPCQGVIAPHMLHLHSRRTNTHIHMQRASFCDSSFCALGLTRLRFSPHIAAGVRRRIGRHKDGRGRERRPIKINTAAPHSFTLKQQLHKTGNKYYLCNRRKPSAARAPPPLPPRPANLRDVEKARKRRRKVPESHFG